MERAVAKAIRSCRWTQTTRGCTASIQSRPTRCIGRASHSVRSFVSLPKARSYQPSTSIPKFPSTQQPYSTESTVEGTIGAGAAGSSEAAQSRQEAVAAPEHLNAKEKEIWNRLMTEMECTELEVQDISGGCGSMYAIDIVSEKFRGLNMLKQQRLVNQVLGEEIKGWHGVQLKTRVP